MHSQSMKALDSSVILSGLGNVRPSRFRKNHLTTIQWQVRFDITDNLCLAIVRFFFLHQVYNYIDILRALVISFYDISLIK